MWYSIRVTTLMNINNEIDAIYTAAYIKINETFLVSVMFRSVQFRFLIKCMIHAA